MIRRWTLFALLACLGVAGAVRPAQAYVRYETTSGNPFSWRTPKVDIVGYPHGLPSVAPEQLTAAIQASVEAWGQEDPQNAACGFLQLALSFAPVTTVPPAAVHDNKNTIALRDGNWEKICSMTKDGNQVCHMPTELALTTVWSRACGEIVEADVEVNASTDFSWADPSMPNPGLHDLQNALTHEMGHFVGLDHTCLLGPLFDPKTGEAIEPVDNNGAKVPLCTSATAAQREATMFPSAQPGDLTKRTLTADDRLGLCEIYPKGTTPQHCGVGSSGAACAVVPDGGALSEGRGRWWVATLALAAAAIAFRRRQSPR